VESGVSVPLTPKQQRFVDEYLVDLNATAAYERAGYKARASARNVNASRLLANAKVRAAVDAAIAARAEATGVTQARVLTELELLAFSSVDHYVLDDSGNVRLAAHAPAQALRAVSSIKRRVTTRGTGDNASTTHEVELKLWSKPETLRMAGQHLGMFKEQHEHSGTIAVHDVRASLAEKLAKVAHAGPA
jgi:phage terminase small subunit